MDITYDNLRELDNPITPVAKYYKSLLREGESFMVDFKQCFR